MVLLTTDKFFEWKSPGGSPVGRLWSCSQQISFSSGGVLEGVLWADYRVLLTTDKLINSNATVHG